MKCAVPCLVCPASQPLPRIARRVPTSAIFGECGEQRVPHLRHAVFARLRWDGSIPPKRSKSHPPLFEAQPAEFPLRQRLVHWLEMCSTAAAASLCPAPAEPAPSRPLGLAPRMRKQRPAAAYRLHASPSEREDACTAPPTTVRPPCSHVSDVSHGRSDKLSAGSAGLLHHKIRA